MKTHLPALPPELMPGAEGPRDMTGIPFPGRGTGLPRRQQIKLAVPHQTVNEREKGTGDCTGTINIKHPHTPPRN